MSKLTVRDQIKNGLQALTDQTRAALPKHISVEKFNRVAMTAIMTTPKLQQVDRNSLYASCMKIAQAGLLPDGKEAAIVPFGDKATAMPMYAGLLKLARNSGEIESISTLSVFENDEFDYWVDEKGEHLLHKPKLMGDRGNFVYAYALCRTRDGGVYIEVMSKQEIDKVRNASRSKDSGPWKTWYEEMAKKTVFRRLSKRLPSSTDLDQAMEVDNELYGDPVVDDTPASKETASEAKDVTPETTKKKSKKKSSKLAKAVKSEPVDDEETETEEIPNYAPSFDEDEELPV